MQSLRISLLFALVAACTAATASITECPQHFANGVAPEIVKTSMRPRNEELCFESFAVMHSGLTRTPLWSAEHLTRERIDAAAALPRINSFHAEKRLRPADRATLADYKASGYDRGHMSPNHDMPTPHAQGESFSLANMIPQARKINQNLWEGIESAVRDSLRPGDQLWVITGPIFEGAELAQLNGRVLVPTSVFKAVYDPAHDSAGAYVASNAREAQGMKYEVMTIAALEQRIGINLFTRMPSATKHKLMILPKPKPHGHRKE